MTKIKKIGVLTSGGDAPGMNAAIRAVTRTGVYYRLKVVGIRHGYEGMINGHFKELKAYSVSDIIQRGGTILKTARSKAFRTVEGRKQAYEKLRAEGIDAVVVIGGGRCPAVLRGIRRTFHWHSGNHRQRYLRHRLYHRV